jgi:hypothetical protein
MILRTLLGRHPALAKEAESLAAEVLGGVSAEDVAAEVHDEIANLAPEDLHVNAGRHSWGYVEPSEAAVEAFEALIAPYIRDMRRRAEAGQLPGAEAACIGIVRGLERAEREGPAEVLDHVQDMPEEEAAHAIGELLRACPRGTRRTALQKRLIAAFEEEEGAWWKRMIRAARSR